MPSLKDRIGERFVLIDANLPLALAESLRGRGLSVRHVSEMNPTMSDTHVQIIMWPNDVLLTRDRNLRFKVGKGKSILLSPRKATA